MKHPTAAGDLIVRLHRIEGQVRGLEGMITAGRQCTEVLTQVASVREALRQVGLATLHHHLETCVTNAIVRGDSTAAEELFPLIEKISR